MLTKLSDVSPEGTLQIIRDYPFYKNKDLAKKYYCEVELIARIGVTYHLRKDEKFLVKVKKDILTKRNKESGRDLSFEVLEGIASRYQTKSEFYYNDPSAYATANRVGVMEDITKHMVVVSFSIPQLALKQITEYLFRVKCKYNNRQAIKPYELDLYYPQFNLAFEYDGKGWHQNDTADKHLICEEKGIKLFTFCERSRRYMEDIKQHLVENLDEINKVTKLNINKEKILFYNEKIRFPKLFTAEELKIVRNNTTKYLKENHKSLYERYRKYNPDNKDFSSVKWTDEIIKESVPLYKSKTELRKNNNSLYQAICKNKKLKYLYDNLA